MTAQRVQCIENMIRQAFNDAGDTVDGLFMPVQREQHKPQGHKRKRKHKRRKGFRGLANIQINVKLGW